MGVAQVNQFWLHLMIILFSISVSSSSGSVSHPVYFYNAGGSRLLNYPELTASNSNLIKETKELNCVYSVYVRTGQFFGSGTDSKITLSLYGADGYGLRIKNLQAWGGVMGEGYDYFERENLDLFTGRGPCLNGPICKMNLTSDGTGQHPGWYCNYVEVTSTAEHKRCNQQLFTVENWLGADVFPDGLTAIKNNCRSKSNEQLSTYDSQSYHVVDVI